MLYLEGCMYVYGCFFVPYSLVGCLLLFVVVVITGLVYV